MNICTFIGRVGAKDAITRFTQAGKPVTGWSIAVDSGFGDNKQTLWIDCNWWGERSQKVAEYIRKGDRIGVSGELGTREHEGKTYLTLRVAEVTLCGNKPEGESGGTSSTGARGGAPNRERPQRTPQAQDDETDPFKDDIPFASQYSRW